MSGSTPPTSEPLAAVLRPLTERGIVGAAIACLDRDGALLEQAGGFADRATETVLTPAHQFRIASVTKTFVAAVVLLLHHERVIDIDAPLARWLPELPFADRVTLYQILTQTGGLPIYSHYRLDEFPPADSRWTPMALIRRAYEMTPPEPPGPPGGPFEYANVGSKVLGRVVELATGRPLGDEVQARLLTPLGLADTVPSGAGGALPDRLARGYFHDDDTPGAPPVDVTDRVPPSFLWSGGDMYSTAADLARWTRALLNAPVLPPALRARLFTELVPGSIPGSHVSHHGLGIMAFERGGRRLFGYRGTTPGFVGVVGYDPDTGTAIALQTNSFSPDSASPFRAAVEPVLFAAFAAMDGAEPLA